MNDCCHPNEGSSQTSPTDQAVAAPCPKCGRAGKAVSVRTIKHQVKPAVSAATSFDGFRFCATPDCLVVYYNHKGETLAVDDLRQPVTQKTKTNPPLCYCFGFDEAMVREEIRVAGTSTIPDRVAAELRAGHCACEIRNPQGSCCLGNVRAAVARATDARSTKPDQ